MRNEKIMDIHLNQQPFGFITAWKDAYPSEENIRKNKQLEVDIQYSGLSYIRATLVWQLDRNYVIKESYDIDRQYFLTCIGRNYTRDRFRRNTPL